jgi:hypothetical protein
MKNFKKLLLSLSLVLGSNIFMPAAHAFDQYLTVKFKGTPPASFLKELNKMTNTTVSKTVQPGTLVLKINGVANNDTLDRYAELFSIMQDVSGVSPLPKEKTDDKINPYYYMNNSIQNQQVAGKQNQQTQLSPETQIINNELIVKYNDNVPEDEITFINNQIGGTSTFVPESNSYIVRLPEDYDPDTAISVYENSGRVQSVEHNTVTVNPPAQPQDPQNPNNYSASGNQSGIITTIPLTKRDVKVTFKIGEEQEAMTWFTTVFGSQLVSKKGFSTYILRFPDNINVKMVVRALKVCSSVASVEISTD